MIAFLGKKPEGNQVSIYLLRPLPLVLFPDDPELTFTVAVSV